MNWEFSHRIQNYRNVGAFKSGDFRLRNYLFWHTTDCKHLWSSGRSQRKLLERKSKQHRNGVENYERTNIISTVNLVQKTNAENTAINEWIKMTLS